MGKIFTNELNFGQVFEKKYQKRGTCLLYRNKIYY